MQPLKIFKKTKTIETRTTDQPLEESNLKREFVLFTAPYLQTRIVVSQLFEPLLVYRKKTTRMCRRPENNLKNIRGAKN